MIFLYNNYMYKIVVLIVFKYYNLYVFDYYIYYIKFVLNKGI